MSAPYLGDFVEDAALHFMWSTNDSNGASITRSTNGEVRVYKDNGVSQSTAGVTDTEDFDSLTGVHVCTIDLSADAFYAVGANYTIVLQGATIDGQTVNAVLAHFSIENRSALRPTTAGRTVDVTAGGAVGIDWANIENPTTAVDLSGTNIQLADTATVVGSVTGAVGSITGNVGGDVQGNVDGSVASIGAGGVIDGAIAAAELANIADACLDRRLDLGVDNGGNTTTTRTWRQALRAMRNRVVIAAGTMTVYEEDDITSDWTGAVTTAAGDPISEINPS